MKNAEEGGRNERMKNAEEGRRKKKGDTICCMQVQRTLPSLTTCMSLVRFWGKRDVFDQDYV